MAHEIGNTVRVMIDGVNVGSATMESINNNTNFIQIVSDQGENKWQENMPRKRTWNISVSCKYNPGDSFSIEDAYDNWVNGTEMIVYFGDTTFSGTYWGGRGLITNVQWISQQGDAVSYSFNIIGVTPLYQDTQIVSAWSNVLTEPFTNWDGFTIYRGYLYNWFAFGTGKLASSGWRVPTNADFSTLSSYLGATVGGKLKETGTTYWTTPNTGATNEVNFNARGCGIRSSGGTFSSINTHGYWWADEIDANNARRYNCFYNSAAIFNNSDDKNAGTSLRVLRDATAGEQASYSDGEVIDTYTGNNGYQYDAVIIGTQVWTNVDLIETKYNDLTDIPEVTNSVSWAALSTGARCSYSNNETNAFDGTIPNIPSNSDIIVRYSWTGYESGVGLENDSGQCKMNGIIREIYAGEFVDIVPIIKIAVTRGKLYRYSVDFIDSDQSLGLAVKYTDANEYDELLTSSESNSQFFAASDYVLFFPVGDPDGVTTELPIYVEIDNLVIDEYTGY